MQRLDLNQTAPATVISHTINTLKNGGLVLFPTETTYGAGVDALNPQAVQKLLQYKSRREGKPLSIAVTDQEMAEKYVEVNESAKQLYARFLPGPMTIISRDKGVVAPGVASEFGTVGVRIPNYPFVLELLRAYGKPITATSANASDAKRPYTIQDILDHLSTKQLGLIDLILDAGELPHNPPSTVIDTTLSTPVVFRQGELQIAQTTNLTNVISASEAETKAIAGKLFLKHWNDIKATGLMIGLNGSLGMGKTIFAKGVADFLQISAPITSPTYSYVQEYDFSRHGVSGKFFHLDIWKVATPEEMARLGWENMLAPQQIIVIEWAQQMAPFLKQLQAKTHIPYLEVNLGSVAGAVDDHRQVEIKE